MELTLTITLSDKLFSLLEDKLPNLGRRVERALTKEIGASVRKQSEISVKAAPVTDTAQPTDEAKPLAEEVPETPQPTTEPKSFAQDEMTAAEKIRAIMHRTRQRIEGEDYKENTASELYKKFHKQLTNQFKQIAIAMGADKPSTLPADRVDQFAAECDALTTDDNGNIVPPPAPF